MQFINTANKKEFRTWVGRWVDLRKIPSCAAREAQRAGARVRGREGIVQVAGCRGIQAESGGRKKRGGGEDLRKFYIPQYVRAGESSSGAAIASLITIHGK